MTADKLEAAKRDIHALRNQLQDMHFRLDRQTQLANSLASEVEQLKAQLKQSQMVPAGYAVLPTELTAENGAKALLMGEFSVGDFIECGRCDNGDSSSDDEYEECEFCDGQGGHHVSFAIDWPTIKDIWGKAVDHFTAQPPERGQCCCGETDDAWRLCPKHGPSESDPQHPHYRAQPPEGER